MAKTVVKRLLKSRTEPYNSRSLIIHDLYNSRSLKFSIS